MEQLKNQIRQFLLNLADKNYNIRWVQAQPKFEAGKRYLSFYDTQYLSSDLGRIEIKELIEHDTASDLVREVKYPLLDPEVLRKHLEGMKKYDPQKYGKYKTFYEQTILDNIDFEGYDVLEEQMTDYEKIRKVYLTFESEYVHHNNRHLDRKTLFAEWLQGLPSVLTVPFYNYDILKNARGYGIEIKTEADEDKFLDEYWGKLANAFFTLKENL